MSRHTEASALNVTVAELKAVVARQAQDLVGLTETSDGKNAALIAAAKKTVGLQEKLEVSMPARGRGLYLSPPPLFLSFF